KEKIRYHRMSRHLYDIGQIINTEYGKKAIENRILFENILGHREMFTPVKTVDYKKLTLKSLSFLPPDDFLDLYRIDYREIQTNLIYGESLKFNKLIEQLISFKNLME
ncbi:MAG: nucleotidyl transferase AbiEii/AbiGii toxin family protein, partial [Candidatus Marinimicrobia bacterium]|nr:nucleotidyl transferase AbiEii/AbiGii toxin family protein [Candidatus Neomarinimicrobiota bacterium]